MKRIRSLPFIFAILFAAGASAQPNSLISHLPENTTMVMGLNLFRIGSKIPKDSLLNSPFMKIMNKNDKENPLEILSKLSTSGISLGQDILIAFVMDTTSASPKSGVHVFGKLNNEELFGKMMQEMFPNDSLHTYGTDKVYFIKGGTLAWNNDLFVFTSASSHQKEMQEAFFSATDTTTGDKPSKTPEQLMLELRAQQRNECFELLQPRSGGSMAGDPRFIELMNTPADMKVWNTGTANPLMSQFAPLSALTKMNQTGGKVKSGITNFENGKIVSESRTYLNAALAEIYKNYKPQPLNTDLLKKLPAGKPMFIMSAAYNKDAAKNFKQPDQIKQVMDSLKKVIPYDFSKLNAVFGNSMMMAVVVDEQPVTTDEKNPFNGMHFYMAMPIADKGKYDELASVVSHTVDSLRSTEEMGKTLKNFKPIVRSTNDLFVLGFREDDVNQFVNNPGTGTVPAWIQEQSGHPVVMQFDFRQIMSLAMNSRKSGKDESAANIINSFKDIVAAGGENENGAIKMRMEYRFMDEGQNSLLQLFNLFGSMFAGKPVSDDQSSTLKEDDMKEVPPPPPPKPKVQRKPKSKIKH